MIKIKLIIFVIVCSIFLQVNSKKILITKSQAKVIGEKIWKNECNGSYEGLTSWNKSEDFPSLGIGHFIWFPKNLKNSSFKQTFPSLIWFMKTKGIKIPKWINQYAPWSDREQFMKEFNGVKLKQLREFLRDTIDIQAQFMIKRLTEALPIITEGLSKDEKYQIINKFYRVANTPNGLYALIDYINFKGYGVKDTDNYNGVKWGLLQVLQKINLTNSNSNILKEYYKAAKKVLIKRILYAPRDERHWWPGWKNRLKTYIS